MQYIDLMKNPTLDMRGPLWRLKDMKITQETAKFFNQDSTHFTVGLNTFSIAANIMLWAHLVGHLNWWWLPLTIILALVGFGNEIQERKNTKNTISFK